MKGDLMLLISWVLIVLAVLLAVRKAIDLIIDNDDHSEALESFEEKWELALKTGDYTKLYKLVYEDPTAELKFERFAIAFETEVKYLEDPDQFKIESPSKSLRGTYGRNFQILPRWENFHDYKGPASLVVGDFGMKITCHMKIRDAIETYMPDYKMSEHDQIFMFDLPLDYEYTIRPGNHIRVHPCSSNKEMSHGPIEYAKKRRVGTAGYGPG